MTTADAPDNSGWDPFGGFISTIDAIADVTYDFFDGVLMDNSDSEQEDYLSQTYGANRAASTTGQHQDPEELDYTHKPGKIGDTPRFMTDSERAAEEARMSDVGNALRDAGARRGAALDRFATTVERQSSAAADLRRNATMARAKSENAKGARGGGGGCCVII